MKKFGSFLLLLFLFACSGERETPLFELMSNTGIAFENTVTDGKLENGFTFRNYYNGGGVGVGDINNDGKPDVCLTSNMGSNKIYLNEGNWKFKDITDKSGFRQDSMWSTGVVFADVNSDGWLDIYICNSGHMKDGNRRNKLYINNRDLTFTESAARYGLDISAYTTQVSFFDYDLDGDLDCFMINNSPIPINTLNNINRRDLPEAQWNVADFLKGGGDHLFKNDNGRYTEVTHETGIHGSLISFGLGVTIGDVNNDGYPDVYVANDSYERDYLYINQRNGHFKDEFEACMDQNSFSSMGADLADVNNDGHPEIFTTDMLPGNDFRLKTLGSFDNIDLFRSKSKSGFYNQFMKNCLQLNNGDGTFSEVSNYSGVPASDWSWGALMFDADNDGLNDIYVCNGVNRDVTNLDFMDFFANDVIQKMVLTGKKEGVDEVLKNIPRNPVVNDVFRNTGNLKFTNISKDWGFTQPSYSNGAAYVDLDNDGDLDLIVNNENQPAFIYKNNARQLNKNSFITLELKGEGQNSFAIGAMAKIYAGGQVFMREQVPSRGFQSSVDYRLQIGLGTISTIDSMVVTWPNLTRAVYRNVTINSINLLKQSDARQKFSPQAASGNYQLFDSVAAPFQKHKEDDYVDFYYERNLPEIISREGPRATTGDVNGDGLIDFYLGGGPGQPGAIYLQQSNGTFVNKEDKIFNQFADFEDVACLLFDADKDADLDLVVCPGGNNLPPGSREMQIRLFKNDGKGNFSLELGAFPINSMNISTVISNDFNGDGYADLFVGGRSVPRDYGVNPSSYLFVNDGKGHFTDIAKTKNALIAEVGMVTSAVWSDVAGDTTKELIVAGEWMAPRIFMHKGDRFTEVNSSLKDLTGWWQSMAVADVNNDGKTDIILGNIGENFYLHPTAKEPVKLWMNDFNQNGNLDKILTRTVDDKDKPVFLKREMEDQIPRLKKLSLKHGDFAKKSIQDLFTKDVLSKSVVKTFNYSSSCVAINKGDGKFEIINLPAESQLSSVHAILPVDLNGDGYPDLVTGGNKHGYLPQLGSLDASFGNVLINDRKGGFSELRSSLSGIKVRGEVRDILSLANHMELQLLFLRNEDSPVLYKLRGSEVATGQSKKLAR